MVSLRPQFPQGLDYDIIYNPSEFVAESVQEVQTTIFEAAMLVVVVVVVFLQSWRASVIPLVAIPVSLIGTFAVLQAFGFSLNSLSLFGLVAASASWSTMPSWWWRMWSAISIRDDAARGGEPAMEEVGGALVAIALVCRRCSCRRRSSLVSPGQFYRQFALTIASATMISSWCR